MREKGLRDEPRDRFVRVLSRLAPTPVSNTSAPIEPLEPGETAVIEDVLADAIAASARASLPASAALLPILHAIQDRLGFVPPGARARIAQALNLSKAEVHGVLTFYHDFRATRPGRHVLKLCRAEACQAMGSAALEAHAKAHLGVDFRETSADGAVTLEPVYCLGNCALSPAVTIDGTPYGRVTPERLEALLAKLEDGPR